MDVKEAYEKLNNLDVEDLKKIGTAPQAVKLAVIALIAVFHRPPDWPGATSSAPRTSRRAC